MTDNASYGGWVRIYRNFLDWEWYGDTSCVRLAVHFMLRANYRPKKWRGIVVRRGQLITSRNGLSDETGLTPMQVRTAIDKLLGCGFITKDATNSYTTITICNYDNYQPKMESDSQVVSQTATDGYPADSQPTTTTEEKKNKRTREITAHTPVVLKKGVAGGNHGSPPCASDSGEHAPGLASSGATRSTAQTRDGTAQLPDRTKPEAGVSAKTGNGTAQVPVGAANDEKQHTAAAELMEWIGGRYTDIATMDEPLTEQQALWMLSRYDLEDIHRLIAAMHNKSAARCNCNVFNTFLNYTQYDGIIRRKRRQREQTGRFYTYDQFCDMTAPGGKYTADDFEIHRVEGHVFRKLKPELCTQR